MLPGGPLVRWVGQDRYASAGPPFAYLSLSSLRLGPPLRLCVKLS
jgi:hypothetical protein